MCRNIGAKRGNLTSWIMQVLFKKHHHDLSPLYLLNRKQSNKDFFCPIDNLSATCWFNTKQSICVSNMTKYILRLFETAPINLNKNKIDNIKESTMTIFVTLLKIYIKREGAQTNYTKCITDFVQYSWKSREKALRTIRC